MGEMSDSDGDSGYVPHARMIVKMLKTVYNIDNKSEFAEIGKEYGGFWHEGRLYAKTYGEGGVFAPVLLGPDDFKFVKASEAVLEAWIADHGSPSIKSAIEIIKKCQAGKPQRIAVLHARINAELDARSRASALHVPRPTVSVKKELEELEELGMSYDPNWGLLE